MQIDEFLELVHKRRSIRRLKPDLFPDEWLDKILESGRWAMSGANGQPWEFIVVKNQATKDAMAKAWAEVRPESDAIEMTRIEELRHPLHSHPYTLPPFKDAAVLIVVIGDRRTYQATVLSSAFLTGEGGVGATYLKNMANATMLMHLAAAALGLGSQWLSVTRPWEVALRSILDVPAVLEIHSVVVLGYPAFTPPPSFRRELKEIVHYEKYDKNKYRTGQDIINWVRASRGNVGMQDKVAYTDSIK